jgi:hypothetical protein
MLKIQTDLGSFRGCAELAARHDGGMASAEVQWLAVTGLRGQGLDYGIVYAYYHERMDGWMTPCVLSVARGCFLDSWAPTKINMSNSGEAEFFSSLAPSLIVTELPLEDVE